MSDSKKEWVNERIRHVLSVYGAFDVLTERGIELVDRHNSVQIPCPIPGHGPDNNPSARYYGSPNKEGEHFFCFKCKRRMHSIDLYAMFNNLEFMKSLSALERRFNIKVPRFDDGYKKEEVKITDIKRILNLLENKLLRVRDNVSLPDYIKFCRVIDNISWDYDHSGKQTLEMIETLDKLKKLIDNSYVNQLDQL